MDTNEDLTKLYIKQLSVIEIKAHDIAKQHLGTSFDMSKSNGFLKWKEKTYKSV